MTDGTASYDVFDTIVTRTFAHPRDLFVHLGVLLHERGLSKLDPLAFGRARWESELAARRLSPCTEVLLDDIYRVLASRLRWSAAQADEAKSLELVTEERHLRGVPLIRARLATDRARTGRLVFLSDMYLPAATLAPWLQREGAMAPVDLLLVSGEVGGNKSSGDLFRIARQRTGDDFARWHHTGDHPFADCAKPRELGMGSTHFTAVHLTARERHVRGSRGEFAVPWRSLLAGAMRLARLERETAHERGAILQETGATVAGPLFHGFVRWTLAEAQRRGLRRLYFLARDGQIFWRVAREIQRARPGGPECRYLYGSRLAFAGPFELRAPRALRKLTATTGHFHSLRQALAPFGLDIDWTHLALPAALAHMDPDINLPQAQREQLADWLLAPARRPVLEAAVKQRTDRARAYLAQEGVGPNEPIGLVDTGWLGSAQRNLEMIVGTPETPARLTGFYLGLMPPESPAPAGEMLGYANTFAPLPVLREESHKVLIELMAQSDHGQVTGFEPTASGWRPRMIDPGPVDLKEIEAFQSSVLAFTRRLMETDGDTAVPDDEFHRTVLDIYLRFHDTPSRREAEVFGFLPHADQLFEQRHASLCGKLDLPNVLVAIADYHRRPPYWWLGGQAALGHAALLRTFRYMKKLRWWLVGRKA